MRFIFLLLITLFPLFLFSQEEDKKEHPFLKKLKSPNEINLGAGGTYDFKSFGIRTGMEIEYFTTNFNRNKLGYWLLNYQLTLEEFGFSNYFLNNAFMYSLRNTEYRTGPFGGHQYSAIDGGICITNNLTGNAFFGIGPQLQFNFPPFGINGSIVTHHFSLSLGGKLLFPVVGNFFKGNPSSVYIALRYRITKIPHGDF
jgi:hypothetical protein